MLPSIGIYLAKSDSKMRRHHYNEFQFTSHHGMPVQIVERVSNFNNLHGYLMISLFIHNSIMDLF